MAAQDAALAWEVLRGELDALALGGRRLVVVNLSTGVFIG
jgi:hypothetical protein